MKQELGCLKGVGVLFCFLCLPKVVTMAVLKSWKWCTCEMFVNAGDMCSQYMYSCAGKEAALALCWFSKQTKEWTYNPRFWTGWVLPGPEFPTYQRSVIIGSSDDSCCASSCTRDLREVPLIPFVFYSTSNGVLFCCVQPMLARRQKASWATRWFTSPHTLPLPVPMTPPLSSWGKSWTWWVWLFFSSFFSFKFSLCLLTKETNGDTDRKKMYMVSTVTMHKPSHGEYSEKEREECTQACTRISKWWKPWKTDNTERRTK